MTTEQIERLALRKVAETYMLENPEVTFSKALEWANGKAMERRYVKDRFEHYRARMLELGLPLEDSQ